MFFAALAIFFFVIKDDYGLSWDEPTRWRSGDTKLDYYSELINSDNKWEIMQHSPKDVYPGLYDVPVALLRRYTEIDPISISRTANVVFGLLAVVATFLFSSLLAKTDGVSSSAKPWMPYVSVAILLSFPEFYGHIFINPKDIPFAATYVLGLYAIGRFAVALPSPRKFDSVFCGLTIGACMSARPPGVVLIAYGVLLVGSWMVLSRPRGVEVKVYGKLALHGMLIALLALLILVLFWPAAHRNPFASSIEAVDRLITFSNEIPVLFRGKVYDAGNTPYYYVVWMFLIKSPLYVLFLAAVSLGVVLMNLRRFKNGTIIDRKKALLLVLLVLAVIVPFAYVLLRQPAIHNGFRHMLYVLPVISLLLAFGIERVMDTCSIRVVRYGVWAGLGLAFLLSAIDHARLHPYQYINYNSLVGGASGSLNRYETEYWFTSGKEAIELLRSIDADDGDGSDGGVSLFATGPLQVIRPYLPEGWRLVDGSEEADYFLGNTQMRADLLVEGKEAGRIERGGLPILILKRVGNH